MKKIFLISLISLICGVSCDTSTADLPDSKSLDKITDANMDLLYNWTEESAKNEKSIPNKQDLDIKVNRKVLLFFEGTEYVLYPFFKKNTQNKQILFIHFILTKNSLGTDKLNNVSFKDLTVIDSDKAYYYYN